MQKVAKVTLIHLFTGNPKLILGVAKFYKLISNPIQLGFSVHVSKLQDLLALTELEGKINFPRPLIQSISPTSLEVGWVSKQNLRAYGTKLVLNRMLHDVTNYLISVVIFVLKHAKSMLDVVFVVFVVGFERFEAPDSRRSQDVGANRYLGFWGLYFSEQSCQSSHAESIQFVTWKSPETAFFGRFFQYELDYELVVSWFILMLGSTSIDSIESIESLTSFFPCSH